MEREACVCDHGYERSDLCAEIIIIIIITTLSVVQDSYTKKIVVLVSLHGKINNVTSV